MFKIRIAIKLKPITQMGQIKVTATTAWGHSKTEYFTYLEPRIKTVEWINADGEVVTNARYESEISLRVSSKEAHNCFAFLVVQSADWQQEYVEIKEIERGDEDGIAETIFSFTPSMEWLQSNARGNASDITAKVYLMYNSRIRWRRPVGESGMRQMARDFETNPSRFRDFSDPHTFGEVIRDEKEADKLTVGFAGTLRIQYFVSNGVWTERPFIYRGGIISHPNTFVNQVVRAINFNIENGKREGNDGGRPSRIALNSNITITIRESNRQSVHSSGFVDWNPEKGVEFSNGVRKSPASVLDHELDHAVQRLTNPEQFEIDRVRDRNNPFTSREEERVITNSEQKTVLANREMKSGQVTRTRHRDGRVISTISETSNVEYSIERSQSLYRRIMAGGGWSADF